jgi:2,3-bisphosphoglycerate-independent phosphoglycerate mutase
MKALVVVCDGLADRPVKALGGKTPLEAADTPNLDALATRGITGIVDPVAPGIRAGSDTSHLAILGYDPYEVYTGRGPFEAAGMGIELREGDVAFRCNFATVDENLVVRDRRAGRIEDTSALIDALRNIRLPGVEIKLASLAYRCALVFRGEGLSYRVSDTDPHATEVKVHPAQPLDDSAEARRTAQLLEEFSKRAHEILEKHEVNARRREEGLPPANYLLARGAGVVPKLESFSQRYRLSGACIATTAIIKGIARLAGMKVIEAEKDYIARAKQALLALEEVDFLLMNIKEADEAGHDHSPEKKVKVIEAIDAMVGEFLDFSQENYIVVMSDHTTPCSVGDHTGDTVPILIAGPEVRTDEVAAFSERACAKGGLNRIRGMDLMPILLDLLNKSEKFGA